MRSEPSLADHTNLLSQLLAEMNAGNGTAKPRVPDRPETTGDPEIIDRVRASGKKFSDLWEGHCEGT